MIRHGITVKLFFVMLMLFLSVAVPSFAAEKIWGSYENKIDGDRVSLSIFPTGGDEKSGKASVIFDLVEKTGRDLEISGVGTVKGRTVILYSRRYRLTVTANNETADFQVEESCGNHRFYEGYSYYSDTCEMDKFKSLSKLSKGLRKR